MPKNAASIMTRQVATIRPDATVAETARLMLDRDIRALPVCAEDGTLLGMISESDLMRPFREEHGLRRPWWLAVLSSADRLARPLAEYIRNDRRRARDLMTAPAITATETAGLAEVVVQLLRHRIKRMPIVRDGRLMGIVSREDLIRILALEPDILGGAPRQPSRIGSDRPAACLGTPDGESA
jgi:CBS domain-containing protein